MGFEARTVAFVGVGPTMIGSSLSSPPARRPLPTVGAPTTIDAERRVDPGRRVVLVALASAPGASGA